MALIKLFLRYSPPSHPEKFTFKYFPQKISTHKKVSQLRADLRSTMTSNSAVDTDAINNKATGEYFVVPSWNKHVNTIIQLLSPSVNVCTAPTDAAFYLPDNMVPRGWARSRLRDEIVSRSPSHLARVISRDLRDQTYVVAYGKKYLRTVNTSTKASNLGGNHLNKWACSLSRRDSRLGISSRIVSSRKV